MLIVIFHTKYLHYTKSQQNHYSNLNLGCLKLLHSSTEFRNYQGYMYFEMDN